MSVPHPVYGCSGKEAVDENQRPALAHLAKSELDAVAAVEILNWKFAEISRHEPYCISGAPDSQRLRPAARWPGLPRTRTRVPNQHRAKATAPAQPPGGCHQTHQQAHHEAIER